MSGRPPRLRSRRRQGRRDRLQRWHPTTQVPRHPDVAGIGALGSRAQWCSCSASSIRCDLIAGSRFSSPRGLARRRRPAVGLVRADHRPDPTLGADLDLARRTMGPVGRDLLGAATSSPRPCSSRAPRPRRRADRGRLMVIHVLVSYGGGVGRSANTTASGSPLGWVRSGPTEHPITAQGELPPGVRWLQ